MEIARQHIETDKPAPFLRPAEMLAVPAEIVGDPALTFENKWDSLRDWAWQEYLADLATTEGMPEGGRKSRLDEANAALLALRQRACPAVGIVVQRGARPMRNAP